MLFGTQEFNDTLIKMLSKDGYRHPCYKECVKHAEEMSWHFYGTKPDELLNRSRPREDPEVTQYRLDNYEPTTKSAADKALHITSKIFNPNLYSIRWAEQNSSIDELKKYTLEEFPKYNSIVNFMKDVLLRKMIADPNGVAVIKLVDIPENGTETPEPTIVLYGSKNIFNYDDDHWLINVECEDDKIYTFEYYDDVQYITFTAYVTSDNKLVIEIDEEDSYIHNFNEIPVWQLTGMSECLDDGEVMYKSFYSSAAPYWNLHIIHESDLFGAYITHLHPQKWELAETCTYRFEWEGSMYPCRAGIIKYGDGDNVYHKTCPQCDGTGRNTVKSPYGVYKINKEKLDENPSSSIAPVEYITIPTEATKMLETRVDNMLAQGMWAINMDIEDAIGANQSGIAKVIDRSAQFDTLFNIGTVVFDTHLQNFYYFVNKYMFSVAAKSVGKEDDINLPEINKPTQFDIVSTSELIASYQVANQSGLDSTYLNLKTQEIISRDLTTNPDLKKFTLLLLDLDPLAGMNQQTVSANVGKGFNSKVDAVIHFNIKSFVERAIRENKGFTTMGKDQQLIILQGYANEFIGANTPKLGTDAFGNPLPTTGQPFLKTA